MLCYVMLCYVILYYIMLCYVMLCVVFKFCIEYNTKVNYFHPFSYKNAHFYMRKGENNSF